MKNPELWKNNTQCPVCGKPANPNIFSCETGYDYCSDECAKQHSDECAKQHVEALTLEDRNELA